MRRIRVSFLVFWYFLPGRSPRRRRRRSRSLQASRGAFRSIPISFTSAATSKPPLIDRLRFRPSVDVGIGDGTNGGRNFDFTYTFPSSRPWNLYVGGGPAINWFYDRNNGGSDTEAGFNFLAGAKNRDGLFFEAKVGVEGSPELKFGVGYTFR